MIRIPRADLDIQNSFRDIQQELNELRSVIDRLGGGAVAVEPPKPDNRLPDDRLTFVPSGTMHSVGLVPDPGSTAGTRKFLREDATWGTTSEYGLWTAGTESDITLAGAYTATPIWDTNVFNTAPTKLALQTVATVANSGITLVDAGYYRISAELTQTVTNATIGYLFIQRYNSGGTLQDYVSVSSFSQLGAAPGYVAFNGSGITNASAGDFIIVTFETTGGALIANDNYNHLTVERLI